MKTLSQGHKISKFKDSGLTAGVAHDPGGARAMLPVLEIIAKRGCPVLAFVSGPAVEIARSEFASLPRQELPNETGIEQCRTALANSVVLLSAAGFYNKIEHHFRRAARMQGIPVVAILDWWALPGERFRRTELDGDPTFLWPDVVCVPDSPAREGLLAEGCPPDRIEITGAPNLEWSQRRISQCLGERDVYREALGLSGNDLCAVFISEPYIRASDGKPWGGVGGYFNETGQPVYGYTAHGILREVADSMLQQRPVDRKTLLSVRPHPMEDTRPLEAMASAITERGLPTKIVSGGDPAILCVAGDLFFGMASILLFEAALAGKTALSVQIGLDESGAHDPCATNASGWTIPVADKASLDREINAFLSTSEPSTAHAQPVDFLGATIRVADVVDRVLANSRQSHPALSL